MSGIMEITVKNLKVAQFASEETLCFKATVYVDGKRAFQASNDGQGGCNLYYGDQKKIRAAEAWAKTQQDDEGDFKNLDIVIEEAVEEVEIVKYVKRLLKKIAIADGGKIFTYKTKVSEVEKAGRLCGKISLQRPNATILNRIPLEDAISLCKKILV